MPYDDDWSFGQQQWKRAASPDFSIELPRHIPIDAFDEHSYDSAAYRPRGNGNGNTGAGGRDMFSMRDDSLGHGESVSTAAHHASALTLSAGLAPMYGSDDGEFDPQRPLDGLMNLPTDISLFNITRTPQSVTKQASARPAVLDHRAQLDKVARSGRFRSHPRETDDALSDVSTVARRSDVDNAPMSPRLAHALGASFSPKRPRSMPQNVITVMPMSTSTPMYRPNSQPQRVASGSSRTASTPTALDEAEDAPHSAATSKFERMARGVASDLQRAKQDLLRPAAPTAATRRKPFTDMANSTPARPAARARTHGRSAGRRIHLPDVTGITVAVASPMRGGQAYYDADEEESAFHGDDHLPNGQAVHDAIEELAGRLSDLEGENSAARRRVRELEMELDSCRADVARERTRVLDAEARERKEREKGKTRAAAADTSAVWQARYQEVLEEKRHLETLVAQLRAQLANMTRELENHQAMIQELRQLRERDARELRAKLAEIDSLRHEVERLAGEVDNLRLVVEDGLRERELRRERSDAESETASVRSASPQWPGQDDEEQERTRRRRERDTIPRQQRERAPSRSLGDNDWPQHTNGATVGSERPTRFIDLEEVSRIEEELTERRLERSAQGPSRFHSSRDRDPPSSHPSRSPTPVERPPSRAKVAETRSARTTNAHLPAAADVSLRGERLQRMFDHAPEHNEKTCTVCHRRKRGGSAAAATTTGVPRHNSAPPDVPETWEKGTRGVTHPMGQMDAEEVVEALARGMDDSRLPPQTVLARVLRELEDDFTHYKGLYVDLADQYKLMDAVSNVVKRNVVAEQLKEVIDMLERKGDHIAALYDLLKFGDKPVAEHGWTLSSGDRLRARRG